ncbi:MAG: DUF3261 domain-containing protein [Myxococcales bacterium FL481]|nr:MAG: DUF3261 domain-containing protein [Myxococcales bacterium FL481]
MPVDRLRFRPAGSLRSSRASQLGADRVHRRGGQSPTRAGESHARPPRGDNLRPDRSRIPAVLITAVLTASGLTCRPQRAASPAASAGSNDGPRRRQPNETPLQPPSAVAYDFLWQQRVAITYQGRTRRFDAALQKRGDTLTLVGLGPMGTPGFVITLEGETVLFENHTGRTLPFSPRYILLDIQRVFFPWSATGPRSGQIDGERVDETHRAGRLVQRRFQSTSVPSEPPIVVDYDGWSGGNDAPRWAHLHHGAFGYQLTVETVAQQRLAPAPAN